MGAMFKVPAIIIYVLGGIWGLFITLGVIYHAFGFFFTLVAFLIFPIALYVAPLYAGFVDENWFPAIVCYGSGVLAIALYLVGSLIDKD